MGYGVWSREVGVEKKQFRFEKLDVWRKAITFARAIYDATNSFPAAERFGLRSQIRRAAVSISANIAEGSGRQTKKDFANFLSIAYGSTMEVVSELELAFSLGYVSIEQRRSLRTHAFEIAGMLTALKKSLLEGT